MGRPRLFGGGGVLRVYRPAGIVVHEVGSSNERKVSGPCYLTTRSTAI